MPDEKEMEKFYQQKTGSSCGCCGCKLTYGTDAGNGFCKKCSDEIDDKDEQIQNHNFGLKTSRKT